MQMTKDDSILGARNRDDLSRVRSVRDIIFWKPLLGERDTVLLSCSVVGNQIRRLTLDRFFNL
jgi:hypothetical protein